MKLRLNNYLFVIWILSFVISGAAGAAVDPLRVGDGARMVAMGRTAAADAGDINAIFVNPANAAYLTNLSLTSMYTNLSEDIAYNFFGIGNKTGMGSFGLAYLKSTAGGFQQTSVEAGRVAGVGSSFDYSTSVLCLTYGKEFQKDLSIGATLKYFTKGFSSIQNGTGSGFDMDLGVLWKAKDNLTIGLSQQNTLPSPIGAINWGTGVTEGIPFNTKLGLNYFPKDNLLLTADFDYARNNPMIYHAGIEWKPITLLAIRGGIDQVAISSSNANTNYTAGIGFNLSGFSFDYAYYYDTLLSSANSAHYFSFSYQFGTAPAKKKVENVSKFKTFRDVPLGYWARTSIGILAGLGIIEGYPDGTFRPENNISRAELATLLVKAKKENLEKSTTVLFSDLPSNHWAANYINKAVALKWVKGYPNGSFKPKQGVTRAEAVNILAQFDKLQIKKITRRPFPDLSISHWAATAIFAAKEARILDYLQGKNFEPNRPSTRAEVAEMLFNTSFIKRMPLE